MSERTGFWTAIREDVDNGMEISVAITRALENPDFHPNVVAILTTAAQAVLVRREVRQAEQSAVTAFGKQNLTSARASLINRAFPLSDGTFVEWTKATPAQHRDRAHWFRDRARTFSNNASLHEMVALLIETAGVTCLGEIESINIPQELLDTLNLPEIAQ